jgi:hypothetical protein
MVTEVSQLKSAAMPLIQLREDQKREVRMLARIIGLEAVASQIRAKRRTQKPLLVFRSPAPRPLPTATRIRALRLWLIGKIPAIFPIGKNTLPAIGTVWTNRAGQIRIRARS